jgi:hypothetical protein
MQKFGYGAEDRMSQSAFDESGYAVRSLSPELTELLASIRQETLTVFDGARRVTFGDPIRRDADVINLYRQHQPLQFALYKVLNRLPSLHAIAGHPELINLAQAVGVRRPIHDIAPQIRCDMAVEDQSMFLAHQDYSYNLGSRNSITVWIPLQDTPRELGALEVIPGSHKQGILDNREGLISAAVRETLRFVQCPVKMGEALVFHQRLVHQSGRNTAENRIRLSIQLRYSDFECPSYAERGWEGNHVVRQKRFADASID